MDLDPTKYVISDVDILHFSLGTCNIFLHIYFLLCEVILDSTPRKPSPDHSQKLMSAELRPEFSCSTSSAVGVMLPEQTP